MTAPAHSSWPTVELDTVRRLKVMAGAAKHPSYVERRFDASFEQVWEVASDLENELPAVLDWLTSFTITHSSGERLSGLAVGVLGYRETFEVVLRPGWCVMQGRALTSGMAAVADGEGCRFAFYTSLRLPGGDLLDKVRGPWSARRAEAILGRLGERVKARSGPGRAE